MVYSRSDERGQAFKARHGIAESTTDMQAAIEHPDTDVVIVALPNFLHEEAVTAVAKAGKAVLVTKPHHAGWRQSMCATLFNMARRERMDPSMLKTASA